MNMKKKIWSLPLLAIAIFAVGMAVTLSYSLSTSRLLQDVGRTDYPALAATEHLAVQLKALHETYKNAVSAADRSGLGIAATQAQSVHAALDELTRIDGKAAMSERLRSAFADYHRAADTSARMMLGLAEGDLSSAAASMQSTHGTLTASIDEAVLQARAAFEASLTAGQSNLRRGLVANLVIAALIVGALVVVSQFVIASVLRQIGGEPEYATQIVRTIAEGDLGAQIAVCGPDRGSLLQAMATMRQTLAGIVASIRDCADQVRSTTAEVVEGNEELSRRSQAQSVNLVRTVGSIEQLTAAVRRNSEGARRASVLAANASAVAARGGDAVTSVVQVMQSIDGSARKVAEISAVIDALAFQTNLLSLNAAVEAARAGEHGRGFAVVAAEVRALAQRSAQAAREIKALVGDSVSAVAGGRQRVEAAVTTIHELVDSVRQVTEISEAIACASNEQQSGIEEVRASIASIDESARRNAALVATTSEATRSLEHLAQRLGDAVSVFRLAAEAAPALPSGPTRPTPLPASQDGAPWPGAALAVG
jgi:methyl-accepting chemotaxis protein